MKLKLKNAGEFRRLLTALLDDLVDARFHFNLHQALARATEVYATEFSQSLTFWGLTFHAHMDAVMVRLCRAYDTYGNPVLNLRNLLDTIEANLAIFNKPNFRQRLKGNAFVDSLAADLKPPDQGQLQKDIEAVSDCDPLVRKLVMWRHNYIAHLNSDFALDPKRFDIQYSLPFAEMDVLLNRALEIGNRYSHLFDASVHGTFMVGRDDYLNVLKAVREYVQAYQRGREEELRRLSATSYAKRS